MRTAFGSLAANSWGRRFLGELSGRLPATLPDRRGVLVRTRDAAHRLFDEKRKCGALVNRKARVIYGLCSLVLAAYREVLAGTHDPECAFETVCVAFLHTHQGRVRLMIRVLLWFADDPAGALSRWSLADRARKMYGSLMEFGQEATGRGTDLIVTRCAFHQFFVEHGEPLLTRVLCGWDRNWMDVIDGSGRPIRVERPTTISTGGDCCRFRFVRETNGPPGPMVDVILAMEADGPRGPT
jgi:hypothetical protein